MILKLLVAVMIGVTCNYSRLVCWLLFCLSVCLELFMFLVSPIGTVTDWV